MQNSQIGNLLYPCRSVVEQLQNTCFIILRLMSKCYHWHRLRDNGENVGNFVAAQWLNTRLTILKWWVRTQPPPRKWRQKSFVITTLKSPFPGMNNCQFYLTLKIKYLNLCQFHLSMCDMEFSVSFSFKVFSFVQK